MITHSVTRTQPMHWPAGMPRYLASSAAGAFLIHELRGVERLTSGMLAPSLWCRHVASSGKNIWLLSDDIAESAAKYTPCSRCTAERERCS